MWAVGLDERPVDGNGRLIEEPDVLALDNDAPAVLVPAAVADPPMDYRPIFRPPRIFPRTDDFEIEGEEE